METLKPHVAGNHELQSIVFDKKVSQDHVHLEAIQGKDQQPDAPSWLGSCQS